MWLPHVALTVDMRSGVVQAAASKADRRLDVVLWDSMRRTGVQPWAFLTTGWTAIWACRRLVDQQLPQLLRRRLRRLCACLRLR